MIWTWRACRRITPLLVALPLGIAGLVGAAPAPDQATDPAATSHQLDAVNGIYRNLDLGLVPVSQGGLAIDVSSPENTVQIFENRVTLGPADTGRDGDWLATFEVVVEADARLLLTLRGTETRFDDRVEAGRQRLRAHAVVRLVEGSDGEPMLEIVERRTEEVHVQIRSQTGEQIVATCRSLSALGLFPVSCDGLQAALSVARVPMPDAGTRFALPAQWLDTADRAFIRRHRVADPARPEARDDSRLTDATTPR
ncbi:MAG: hypothetical protein AAGC60_18145 [Acidobacteriota bacterium]